MKKFLALIMAALMVLTITACGNTEDKNNGGEASTVGQTLLADFKADNKGTPEEIAQRLISNEIIQFMGGAMPVEEGLLSGFDNTEIKGFKSGAMFGPMMSSIAFVGYVFELEDGADVEAFKTTLKDNANLRWQICVEAEELIVENEGNKVFFLMCPKSFEQPEENEENGIGNTDAEINADDIFAAEDGITLE